MARQARYQFAVCLAFTVRASGASGFVGSRFKVIKSLKSSGGKVARWNSTHTHDRHSTMNRRSLFSKTSKKASSVVYAGIEAGPDNFFVFVSCAFRRSPKFTATPSARLFIVLGCPRCSMSDFSSCGPLEHTAEPSTRGPLHAMDAFLFQRICF